MGRYDGGQGLFSIFEPQNRGVVKLAPDAIVSIMGAFGATVLKPATGDQQSMNFSEGITSINIQNSVDPPGSSTATIEIVTPLYDEKSNYWVSFKSDDGNLYRVPYFVPMMELQIFLKGRFLVDDKPQYYPAFSGFIVNVEENYSGGLYKLSLQCADMLHWWQYIQDVFRPSVSTAAFTGNQQNLTVWGSHFEEANPFEIIYDLTLKMGMGNFFTPDWIAKVPGQGAVRISQADYQKIYSDIASYWNTRFQNTVHLLKMFGAEGNLLKVPNTAAV